MTHRTSPQKVKEQLASNLKNGHLSFEVLLVAPAHRNGRSHYIVAVPKAVMYSGVSGWVSKRIFSTWGEPTEFGNDLFRTVNQINGVSLSLQNDHPHVVRIFVDGKLGYAEPLDSFYYVAHGLPAVVCEAIEEVILRNDSFGQRFAEWLRRLV